MTENFSFTNSKGNTYYLNTKEVEFGGKARPIYFFSKDVRDTACPLPDGYTVGENPRNGFVTLKKVG